MAKGHSLAPLQERCQEAMTNRLVVKSSIGYDLIAFDEECAAILRKEGFASHGPMENTFSPEGIEYSKREVFSWSGKPLGYECWTIVD